MPHGSRYELGQCVSFQTPTSLALTVGMVYGKILSVTLNEASKKYLYSIQKPGHQEPVVVEEEHIGRPLTEEETLALYKRLG